MGDIFKIYPVGFIRKKKITVLIEIDEKYNDALWEKIIFENQDTSISISPVGLSMRF